MEIADTRSHRNTSYIISISILSKIFTNQNKIRFSLPTEWTAVFESCGRVCAAGATPTSKMIAQVAAPTGRARASTTTYSMSNVSRSFLQLLYSPSAFSSPICRFIIGVLRSWFDSDRLRKNVGCHDVRGQERRRLGALPSKGESMSPITKRLHPTGYG